MARALVGIGFIDETDVTLVAPTVNLAGEATDFYDQTAAVALGAEYRTAVPDRRSTWASTGSSGCGG